MWAQLISMRLREGHEHELAGVMDALDAVEQPDSGLLHSLTMTEQGDARQVHVLVVFASEEQARAREDDPRRQDALDTRAGEDGRDLRGSAGLHRPDRGRGSVLRPMTSVRPTAAGPGRIGHMADDEVTRQIAATPEKVWSLVADVTRMDQWSPVIARCEWLGDCVGTGGRRPIRRPQPPDGCSLVV